jgi:hypothetical protein
MSMRAVKSTVHTIRTIHPAQQPSPMSMGPARNTRTIDDPPPYEAMSIALSIDFPRSRTKPNLFSVTYAQLKPGPLQSNEFFCKLLLPPQLDTWQYRHLTNAEVSTDTIV